MRIRRGVRLAKEWLVSNSRTMPEKEIAITPPLRRCSPWKRFGRAVLDPYLRSRAREQNPRFPLMAKPEKPNNELSIGAPKGGDARVSEPEAEDHALRLTGTCTGL